MKNIRNIKNPNTKDRALELGNHYLQTVGYNGFSFQTIADALEIRKASLHYYFASKEDLGIALIQQHQDRFAAFAAKVIEIPSIEKLDRLIQFFDGMAKDHRKICPLGILCSDYNTLSKGMHKSLKDFYALQRTWLVKTFKQGIAEKKFKKNLDAQVAADIFLASIQGGLQIARLQGNSETFKKNLKGLLKTFTGN